MMRLQYVIDLAFVALGLATSLSLVYLSVSTP